MALTRTPSEVLDRLLTATNAHDLDGLVDCFAVDYILTDPAHPARSFTGTTQVRKNWETIFAGVPDIRIEVDQRAVGEAGFWLEAAQTGTRRDGARLDNRMVFIASVVNGRITRAHVYVSPVEPGGPDVDAAVSVVVLGSSQDESGPPIVHAPRVGVPDEKAGAGSARGGEL